MKPLDPPLLAAPPDPLPEAAHQALRDATVALWRDLAAKAERTDQAEAEAAVLRERVKQLAREKGVLTKRVRKFERDQALLPRY